MTSVSSPPELGDTSTQSMSSQGIGLKKVLSGRRRSSEVTSDGRKSSADSVNLEKTSTLESTRSSPSRDANPASAMRKLIPGHGKRQRKKIREEEVKAALEADVQGGLAEPAPTTAPLVTTNINKSNSSLLTDTDFETPPPLVSRNSHNGYFTTSSPLMASRTANENHARAESDGAIINGEVPGLIPSIVSPGNVSREPSPKSQPSSTAPPPLHAPGVSGRTNSLQVNSSMDGSTNLGKLRGKSPARKMRDIFKSGRSPRSSPERSPASASRNAAAVSRGRSPLASERKSFVEPEAPQSESPISKKNLHDLETSLSRLPPALHTDLAPPRTPPGNISPAPATTITPPTPVEKERGVFAEDDKSLDEKSSNVSVTSAGPGPAISHRRVRSAASATHHKSKLSTSTIPPLTPTIEEIGSPVEGAVGTRNITPGGGFFSSFVSVAQNAASTLSNLTGQNNRNRSATAVSEPMKSNPSAESDSISSDATQIEAAHKKLAVETLGSGDLDFSHFGLDGDSDDKTPLSARPNLAANRQDSELNRYEAQAKVEDLLAKRAVSAAYERTNDTTPVAEIADPLSNLKHSQTFDLNSGINSLTTPNGSIFEDETGPIKRSNSVRSKIANRRSRGSSIATGQSTIAAIVGASTATLVNPASVTKNTGFTPAPKTRNRGFHQQFRSVPEDDNLIEDYSCALQREILLAGRIYISEGHICFSSNILGWVTTLIISFEEIVSIEREYTAMIIPNAIAIQTLHARHTFRSLLSREATFDLMIGIWKVNHPASFQKSVNGKQMIADQTRNVVADAMAPVEAASPGSGDEEGGESDSEDDDDDDDDDDESAHSTLGSGASVAGSEFVDAKSVGRKPSGIHGASSAGVATVSANGDGANAGPATGPSGTPAVAAGSASDFPGPATHAPTDCSDAASHYDKVIKDEIIAAPLGKIYSLLYGPESGAFVRKYIVNEGKCTDFVMDDDKRGLNDEIKERQYSYIKPLGGPVGPKQTRCITVENLTFFDLGKSVSVTCTTQTPDVPSGNVFSTKTRYCLSWAPGNATRLQMNCTIEWTGKSWLKVAIDRGANDGQQQYGDGLVKALKVALGRSRATTVGSKGAKVKKKRKGEKKVKNGRTPGALVEAQDWGLFEPLRSTLGPVGDVIRPIVKLEFVVTILFIMVLMMWFRGPGQRGDVGYPTKSLSTADRSVAYEDLWTKEETHLWDWLEARAGVNKIMLTRQDPAGKQHDQDDNQHKESRRRRQLKSKDLAARMRAEKWNQKEIEEAVRFTRARLDEMQNMLDEQQAG